VGTPESSATSATSNVCGPEASVLNDAVPVLETLAESAHYEFESQRYFMNEIWSIVRLWRGSFRLTLRSHVPPGTVAGL